MDEELDKIVDGKSNIKTAMAVFAVTLRQARDDIKDVKLLLANEYAPKSAVAALESRIRMLERIIYSAVGVILVTVLGALLTLVVRK